MNEPNESNQERSAPFHFNQHSPETIAGMLPILDRDFIYQLARQHPAVRNCLNLYEQQEGMNWDQLMVLIVFTLCQSEAGLKQELLRVLTEAPPILSRKQMNTFYTRSYDAMSEMFHPPTQGETR